MGATERAARMVSSANVDALTVASYSIPTQSPESDGTYEWNATTLIVVDVHAGGIHGFGYTYGDRATAALISGSLAPLICGTNACDIPARWSDMAGGPRPDGRAPPRAGAGSAPRI